VKKLTKIDFWGDEGESYKGDSAINSNMDTLLAVIGFLIGRYCRDH